jgi:hypothetical protein
MGNTLSNKQSDEVDVEGADEETLTAVTDLEEAANEECSGVDRFARLNLLLNDITCRDLLIVDEAHAASNKNNLHVCLSYLRGLLDKRPPERRPRLLLMTATPYGTGVHNLNALLRLLGVDKMLEAGREAEIATVDAFVNVTLPWIMQTFGRITTDELTGRTVYALAFPGSDGSMKTAFFPELMCRNADYTDCMLPVYAALEKAVSPGYTAYRQARLRLEALLLDGSGADSESVQRAEKERDTAQLEFQQLQDEERGHSLLSLFQYMRMAQSSVPAIDGALQKRAGVGGVRLYLMSFASLRGVVFHQTIADVKALGAVFDSPRKLWYTSTTNPNCEILVNQYGSDDARATFAAAGAAAAFTSASSLLLAHGLEDAKLQLLVKLIAKTAGQTTQRISIVVFCCYINTAVFLCSELRAEFPGAFALRLRARSRQLTPASLHARCRPLVGVIRNRPVWAQT